jgi:protein-S-isoprenylcysteine O-methyltransferase Ste14
LLRRKGGGRDARRTAGKMPALQFKDEFMNDGKTFHHVTRARLFSLASVGVFLIAISEMIFMASPFAAYFYSVYSPLLTWTENHSFLIWLTDFFVPHLSTPASAWFGFLAKLPRYLFFVGLASFAVHAVYLYWMKFVPKGIATGLLYRYIRHPQYLSFAIAGLGLIFYWPRFINLLFWFVMLIGYYALAQAEEQRVERQYGEQYLLYKQRTAMFLPGRLGERMAETIFGWLPWPERKRRRQMRGYAALVLLLGVCLAAGFLVRAASIRNLNYVALPNALVVFLDEPPRASLGEIERELTRVLASQPAPRGSVPLFYVVSEKHALHHLLLDSGITRDVLTGSRLPDASWYLVSASASYCSAAT